MQLPLPLRGPRGQQLPPHFPTSYQELLIGSWAGGERYVDQEGRLEAASVWIHFESEGKARLSLRYKDDPHPLIALARWSLVNRVLELNLGRSRIRGEMSMKDGVVYWAGEVLVRIPSAAANLRTRRAASSC